MVFFQLHYLDITNYLQLKLFRRLSVATLWIFMTFISQLGEGGTYSNKWPNELQSNETTDIILVKDVNSSLSQSQEDDVYIGYSNNPWGHSSRLAAFELTPESMDVSEQDNLSTSQQRRRRHVFHLYNMVACATGCNPLAYKGYGCYCGFLGSGFSVDSIDRCCKMHDWCYHTANCPLFLEYFVPYLWKCYRRRPLCAIDHGLWGGPGSCSQRLCECDRRFAECLRRYPCPRHKAVCTSSPWRMIQNIFMF